MDNTWVFTYTSAQPSMAMINVPCMPKWESAYNNADSSPAYWLTYEQVDETSIYVDMKEAGKTDFFLFEVGSTTYALICTYVAEAQGGASLDVTEFFDPYGISGDPVITAMSPSSEHYQMLSQFSTNLMEIRANTNIVVSGTTDHPFTAVDVYDMEMSPASTPNKIVQTMNNGMAMIFAEGLESGDERVLVFKNGDDIVSVCHYIFQQ